MIDTAWCRVTGEPAKGRDIEMTTETKKPEALRDYYTPKEAAAALGLNPRTLMRWRISQEGPPVAHVGKFVYYHIPSLEAWVRNGGSTTPRPTAGLR